MGRSEAAAPEVGEVKTPRREVAELRALVGQLRAARVVADQ